MIFPPLDDPEIPAGADPVWQPPFWLTIEIETEEGFRWMDRATYTTWWRYFEDRMDAKLYAMTRDAMLYGFGAVRIGGRLK